MDENRFDALIGKEAKEHKIPPLLLKALVWQESRFNPDAISSHGAIGLCQLMPTTDKEIDGDYDGKDPEGNLDNGARYLRWQYTRFPEIRDEDERWKFSLAAYNCGRAYVNQALRLAREAEFGFRPRALIRGEWQTWEYSCTFLSVPLCEVKGKRPDYKQVWDYVGKIWKKYQKYNAEFGMRNAECGIKKEENMNPLFLLLPFVIEAVKMIEAKVSGSGKGKLKKKKVTAMVMDSVEAAVAAKQLDLGGLPFASVKPLIGTGIDLAVTMLNKTGVFRK